MAFLSQQKKALIVTIEKGTELRVEAASIKDARTG